MRLIHRLIKPSKRSKPTRTSSIGDAGQVQEPILVRSLDPLANAIQQLLAVFRLAGCIAVNHCFEMPHLKTLVVDALFKSYPDEKRGSGDGFGDAINGNQPKPFCALYTG